MSSFLRFVCSIILISILNFSLYGQINISGTVKDPAGKPIAGAMVSIVSAGKSTTTDSNGVYSIATGTTQVFPHAANRTVAQPTVKGSTLDNSNEAAGNLAKTPASVDSMLAGAVGYNTVERIIDNYTGAYNFVLEKAVAAGSVLVIQTSQAGDKLAVKPSLALSADDGSNIPALTVDPRSTFQQMLGFGYAFTETAVYNLAKVDAAKRKQILGLFFNPFTGVGTTLMRSQIGSCDFSASSYDYDGVAGDASLANFSIAHERQWMIPMIKDACAVPGADIKIFSSPWSPPAWMKTSNSRTHGGSLRTEYYGTWALYVSKYLQAFAAEGIKIWGITLQNEPQANQVFESTLYSAEQERDLLKIIGAQLASDNLDGVKIFVHDHNKGHLSRANTILSDATAAKYATGIAFHWYDGDHFSNVAKLHADFPDKQLIGTEVAEPGPKYGDWGQAERETHDLIGDVNNWAGGWTEWNLVCDERGGPGWTGSVGSSPIHTDFTRDSIVINPHYYYIGHFSKYVRPGAVRIGLSSTAANLEAAAFRNINGAIVVNVMNKNGSPVTFKLKQGDRIIKPTIPAHAIISFIFF